jgi:cytochrome b561
MTPMSGRDEAMASAETSASERAYAGAAIALHWIIAALIITQICIGWYMNHLMVDHSPAQERMEDLHISIGITTFLLILVRIAVRLLNPPPPLPSGLAPWERLLAHASHLLFYLLMLALPLTGWALVSSRGQHIPFWGIEWPKLPVPDFLTGPAHRPARKELEEIHTDILVYIALANVALHVAGALKHQFDGNPVLWRMAPFLRRSR